MAAAARDADHVVTDATTPAPGSDPAHATALLSLVDEALAEAGLVASGDDVVGVAAGGHRRRRGRVERRRWWWVVVVGRRLCDSGLPCDWQPSKQPGQARLLCSNSGPVQPGVVTPLMPLGAESYGGLTVDNTSTSTPSAIMTPAKSSFNRLNPQTQTTDRVAYLGAGFTGGLTYNFADGNFYAIATGAGGSALYSINARTWAVRLVGGLGAFLLRPGGHPVVQRSPDRAVVRRGQRQRRGPPPSTASALAPPSKSRRCSRWARASPAAWPCPSSPPSNSIPLGLLGELVGISGDASGSAVINQISLQGPVTPVYEVGAEFSDGLAVVGTHTYADEGNLPVSGPHQGGQRHRGHRGQLGTGGGQATVARTSFQDLASFQGLTSGPLTLATFLIPNGVETGPGEYTTTIDWRNGGGLEAGIVTAWGPRSPSRETARPRLHDGGRVSSSRP